MIRRILLALVAAASLAVAGVAAVPSSGPAEAQTSQLPYGDHITYCWLYAEDLNGWEGPSDMVRLVWQEVTANEWYLEGMTFGADLGYGLSSTFNWSVKATSGSTVTEGYVWGNSFISEVSVSHYDDATGQLHTAAPGVTTWLRLRRETGSNTVSVNIYSCPTSHPAGSGAYA